jgi:hypothetical protein
MPLLDVLEPEQSPLELVLPRKRLLHAISSRMHGVIAHAFAPSLRGFSGARVLLNVRNQTRIEDRLAMMPRIKSTITIEIRASEPQTRQPGHPLQGLQPLGQQHRIRFIDRCHRQGSEHIAVVVNDRDDLFALLVCVTRGAHAIATFFGHRVGAITMEDAQVERVVLRQMPHTGDKGMRNRPVISPLGEDFVDGGVVDFGLALAICWHGQTRPLHAGVQHPQDEVEDTLIAECALGSMQRHGEVR